MLPELAAPLAADELCARCLDSYRPGARTVAGILAETLRARGLQCLTTLGSTTVRAVAPGRSLTRRDTVDLVILADEDLLADPESLAGLDPDGVLVVATAHPPHAVRRQLRRYGGTVVTVDADAIAGALAMDVGVPLLGAACRALPGLGAAQTAAAVWDHYAGAWPGAGPAAVRALEEGYRRAAF